MTFSPALLRPLRPTQHLCTDWGKVTRLVTTLQVQSLAKGSTPASPGPRGSLFPSTAPHLQARKRKPDAANVETSPKEWKTDAFPRTKPCSFFLLQFPSIQSLPGLTYSPHNSTLPGPSRQQGKGGARPSGTGIRTERPEPRAIALCLSTVGHGGQWGFPHTFSPALLLWFPFPSKSEAPLGGSKLLPVGRHP